MIRKRRNAYLAALFILVGVICLIVGTFVPAVDVTSDFSAEVKHITLSPSGGIDASTAFPIVIGFGSAMLVLAALLALTRRRGLGILWRVACLLCLIGPVTATAYFWYLVQDPTAVVNNNDLSLGDYIGGILGGTIGDATPGTGLWLLTFGCIVILVGCFVPSQKHKEVIIRDDDPGYRDFNPYVQRFQQEQFQTHMRQQPPPPPVWHPQQPTNDPYGPPSYNR